jgi:hypothetical protein
MKLMIINIKINSASRYYRLYKVEGEKIVEIGFSGLGTDYEEIKGNKKNYKDGSFVYVSKKYRADGIPRDIVYYLRHRFSKLIMIEGNYNGVQVYDVKTVLKSLRDNFSE